MATKVYGASDDLIEVEGDVNGEVACIGMYGVLLAFSDGTILKAKYGKDCGGGIWEITVLGPGGLFERHEPCYDEDAEVYSDVVHFRDGLKYAYAATEEWEQVY